jgi:hypothetical protein
MPSSATDGELRRALLALWVEPWRSADVSWCGTGAWPAWLDWVLLNRPELLPGLWTDWCHAVGSQPESGLVPWLESGAPVEGAWRDVARLGALSADGLLRVLLMCGAVSVFSRSDGGMLWVKSQAHPHDGVDSDMWRQCALAGWRVSRVYRVAPAEGSADSLACSAAFIGQGLRILLAGAHAHWGDVWALVWPHWRWRLAPAWTHSVGLAMEHTGDAPRMCLDSSGFLRVWAQVMAREEGL